MLVNYKMFEDMEACEPALEWFKANFEGDVEFDSVYPKITDYSWALWLIRYCSFAQTNEMMEHYKSLNPSYNNVRWLMSNCDFAKEYFEINGIEPKE